jgi:hypothetical protein
VTGCANDPTHDRAEPAAALCGPCLDAASRDLMALPRDFADLEALLPASTAGALRTRVSGSGEAPSPLNLGVDALQRAIHAAVTAWEPAVREAARLAPERTRGVRDGWAVAAAVDVMAPRTALISTLAAQWCLQDGVETGPVFRDGCEALRAFRGLHGQARAILGVRRLVHRLPGECSRCGLEALRRPDGSESVFCAGCGQRWTWDDYRRYVSLILGNIDTRTERTIVDNVPKA